jgi:hypothetical protein
MDLKALAIQLRGAADQLDQLAEAFGLVSSGKPQGRKGKRVLSAAARAAISKAQKARWAKKKGA